MIWGDGDKGLPLKRADAAKAVGISDVTLRQALSNPLVVRYYRDQLEVLRTGERPRSIAKIAQLRDKAKSERTQFDAAKYLDGGDRSTGVTVNVGVNVAPGYLVTIPETEGARQMLKLAGSHANVLDQSQSVPNDDQGTTE
jgi:hypothetical protein